jgi:hypothetical protein
VSCVSKWGGAAWDFAAADEYFVAFGAALRSNPLKIMGLLWVRRALVAAFAREALPSGF